MKSAPHYRVTTTIALLLALTSSLIGQSHSKTNEPAFFAGEKVLFDVYYNWGFVWLHAGEVDFYADTVHRFSDKVWHFVSTGKSRPSYDWFFKVRDRYESWATLDELKPIEFVRNTHEGGYVCYNHYLFDHQHKIAKVISFTSKREKETINIPLSPNLVDVLTATYITRNIDPSHLKIGDKIPINLLLDNSPVDLYIRYQGKETIRHKNKKTYNCLKFTTSVAAGSIFKEGEAITVWVTNDRRHIPVLVQAEILVGAVKVYLNDGSHNQ